MLIGRLAKWALILTQFSIKYVPQKAIKGQALADFLAAYPVPDDSPLLCELPGEEILFMENEMPFWKLYFDGASSLDPRKQSNSKNQSGRWFSFCHPKQGHYQASHLHNRTQNQ